MGVIIGGVKAACGVMTTLNVDFPVFAQVRERKLAADGALARHAFITIRNLPRSTYNF